MQTMIQRRSHCTSSTTGSSEEVPPLALLSSHWQAKPKQHTKNPTSKFWLSGALVGEDVSFTACLCDAHAWHWSCCPSDNNFVLSALSRFTCKWKTQDGTNATGENLHQNVRILPETNALDLGLCVQGWEGTQRQKDWYQRRCRFSLSSISFRWNILSFLVNLCCSRPDHQGPGT